jgi:hypothetical protein
MLGYDSDDESDDNICCVFCRSSTFVFGLALPANKDRFQNSRDRCCVHAVQGLYFGMLVSTYIFDSFSSFIILSYYCDFARLHT